MRTARYLAPRRYAVSGNRDCREKLKFPLACPDYDKNTYSVNRNKHNVEEKEGIKTWEDCAKECKIRDACRYWSWNGGYWDRHKCKTMTDADKMYPYKGMVTGSRDCPGNDNEEGGNAAIIFNAERERLYRIMIVHEENKERQVRTNLLYGHMWSLSFQDVSSFQAYFSVTINGLQVGKVKSKITSQMSQVKVYAGDADLPAAHAHYKNLIWETISGRACLTFAFYFSLCSKIQGILIPAFICTALI